MKRLFERVLGRSSADEDGPDALVQPTTVARESPASNEPVGSSGPADSRASVIQALQEHVARSSRGRLSAQEVREDAEMFDRGYLDSLSYVEFLVFIEHTYRVRIDDTQLAGHLSTIGAMAEHILQEQTSPVE